MKKIKVVNIIPTYNEKENIEMMLTTLKQIGQKNPQYSFQTLIMDDNSPDGTSMIVKKRQAKDKSIYLLTGPKKGFGYAMLRGFKYAINNLKAQIVIPNDCDFSWDPLLIPKLLKKVSEGYDVVCASRYRLGSQTKGWSTFRKINHFLSNVFFATYIAGITEVKDHNGNFRAIRVKNVLDKIPFNRLLNTIKVHGFAIQTYILYELSKVTNKFYEYPAIFKFRTKGEAKISQKYLKFYLKDALEYMKLCLLIRLARLKIIKL